MLSTPTPKLPQIHSHSHNSSKLYFTTKMANSISAPSSNPIPKSKTTINDLPQHILTHILTFLYIQDAIQTSRISRSFRDLWHFLPSLHFNIEEFYSRSPPPARCDHTRQMFSDFVSQTLMFRQLNPLTKLHLTFEYTNDVHRYHVKSWVRYAINLSVSELVIDFRDEDKFDQWDEWDDPDEDEENHRLYQFDFHILEICKSRIKVLELYKCDFLISLTNPIKFVFLKSLRVEATARPVFYEDVCYLLAQCVNLEILKFVKLEFNTEEEIVFHSSSLKELYFNLCSNDDDELPLDLDICCPSLQKISLVCSELGKVIINKDTSNLVDACIDFIPLLGREEYNKSWEKMLSYFTNISSIHVWEELLESNEVPAGCERFASNVKHLELYCYYSELDLVGVAALLKLLPKLEILVLDNRGRTEENLHPDYRKASTVFTMPCLKKVVMRKYHNTERERHFIKLFKTNGIVSDKIKLLRPSNQSEYSIN